MEYDILKIQEESSTIKVEANKVASFKKSEITRQGVRRFEGDRVYQTSRLGSAVADELIADTKKFGGPGVPHEFGYAPARQESRQGIEAGRTALEEFEAELKKLVARYPDFIFNGSCSVGTGEVNLTSSYGLDLSARGGQSEWYVIYQRRGSGNMMDGFIAERSAKPNIREIFESHVEFLEAQGKIAKINSGKMPVLFMDTMSPLKKLVESTLVHRYKDGTCLYAGRMGEKIFSSGVSIVDRAFDPRQGQIQFFDGEGTVRANDNLKVIEDGKFVGLLSDLRFGKKHGMASTGNGIRSYKGGVHLAPRNLEFVRGSETWRKMISQLDHCLVAMIAAGGDSNDLGEFSTPVQVGYLFEKGRLVGQAPQLTVKAKLDNFLGADFIGVASDGFYSSADSPVMITQMDVLLN